MSDVIKKQRRHLKVWIVVVVILVIYTISWIVTDVSEDSWGWVVFHSLCLVGWAWVATRVRKEWKKLDAYNELRKPISDTRPN